MMTADEIDPKLSQTGATYFNSQNSFSSLYEETTGAKVKMCYFRPSLVFIKCCKPALS